MEKDIKISDPMEFQKQHRGKMLKDGHYIQIELICATGDEIPYHQVDLCKCTAEEVMRMYLLLESALEQFKKDYPEECSIAKEIFGMEYLDSYKIDEEE